MPFFRSCTTSRADARRTVTGAAVRDAVRRATPWALVTAISFAVLAYTACPTVFAGDSGELALAGKTMGVAHPPGYPLFVLLARVATMAGGEEPAGNIGLMNALLAALAAGGLYICLRRWTASPAVAASGAGVFAFSPSVWGEATVAEVYASVAVYCVALLLVLDRIDRKNDPRHVYLLAYLAGLSIVVHQSLVLFAPVLVYVVWRRRKTVSLVLAGLAAVVGTTPYLVLLIRSQAAPAINWGAIDGGRALLAVILRRNYGPIGQNPPGFELVLAGLQGVFTLLRDAFPLGLLFVSPLGIVHLAKKRPWLGGVLAGLFLSFLIGLIGLVRPYPDRVHLYQLGPICTPLYVIVAAWIGMGLCAVASMLAGRRDGVMGLFRAQHARSLSPVLKSVWGGQSPSRRRLVARGLTLAVLVLPLWLVVRGFERNNLREFFDARVYGENILRSVPANGTLVVDGDNETFIIAYVARALGMRPDVDIVHRKGYLLDAPPYLRRSSRTDLEANVRRREADMLSSRLGVRYATFVDISHVSGWALVRDGLIYRAVGPAGAGKERSGRSALEACDAGVLDRQPRDLDFLVRKFAMSYLQARWDYASLDGDGVEAAHVLEAMAEFGHDFAEAQYFVGRQMEREGRLEDAYAAFLRAARLSPQAPYPWQALARVAVRRRALSP